MKNSYKIPYLLWGGGKAIGRPDIKERLVGVADYKLKTSPKVNLSLTGLRNKPTYSGVNTRAFLDYSEAHGLVNKRGRSSIYYIELNKLAQIADAVKE